jgi:hypothetical protein
MYEAHDWKSTRDLWGALERTQKNKWPDRLGMFDEKRKCGRQTGNHAGSCDDYWKYRERIYAERNTTEAAAEKDPKRVAAAKRCGRCEKGKNQ